MDIALLSKMVGELILDNDQVGLPGIGTFVAEMVPAAFSDRGYTINPPYRRIVFSASCLEDELLCALYCKANSDVDMPTAKEFLKQYLADLKTILLDKKVLILPGLGRLRTTRDNGIVFIPDENLDIFPEGCGLQPVSLKTHITDTTEIVELNKPRPAKQAEPVTEKPEEQEEEEITVTEVPAATQPTPKSRWWIIPVAIAAVAAAAFGIFLLLVHFAPDFIDSILYSPEELKIINH